MLHTYSPQMCSSLSYIITRNRSLHNLSPLLHTFSCGSPDSRCIIIALVVLNIQLMGNNSVSTNLVTQLFVAILKVTGRNSDITEILNMFMY